jgi:hypothetical protein
MEFQCCGCQKFLNLHSRYPMFYQNAHYCLSCNTANNYNLAYSSDQIFIAKLDQELVDSNCHPEYEAKSIDFQTFKVYCIYCYEADHYLLESFHLRSYLRSCLEQALNQVSYPREYIKEFREKLQSQSSCRELLTCLKKKFLFDSQAAFCLPHLNQAYYYDSKTFTFQCEACRSPNSFIFNQHQQDLMHLAYQEYLRTSTPNFRSFVLKCVREQQFPKNFFIEIGYMVASNNSMLSAVCLICEESFDDSQRLKVKLHQEDLHEICYRCFCNASNRICPIDYQPFPPIQSSPPSNLPPPNPPPNLPPPNPPLNPNLSSDLTGNDLKCIICEQTSIDYLIPTCKHFCHLACYKNNQSCKCQINSANAPFSPFCYRCTDKNIIQACETCNKSYCYLCITNLNLVECCKSIQDNVDNIKIKCPGCLIDRSLSNIVPIKCKTHNLVCKKCWNIGSELNKCLICDEKYDLGIFCNCSKCNLKNIKYIGEYHCTQNCDVCEFCQTMEILEKSINKEAPVCADCGEELEA